MKKTLTAAAISSVLVLGLASSALALHETATAETPTVTKGETKVTLDGSVRVRGFYNKNSVAKDAAGLSGYDTKVQVGTTAKVSDQATGRIVLESGSGTSDVEGWGTGLNLDSGYHNGGYKMDTVTILEAWLNYQPGAWGVKAGHMPLALGNKVFFDHTGSGQDALVFYANPTEATHIAALTIKFDEQAGNDSTDDMDGYVALITHKVSDTLNLGANYTLLQGGDTNENMPDMALSNLGVTVDGKVGAISYMLDGEYQFGDINSSIDASGWAVKVGGNYDLGAGKIGLVYGYGSGDADSTDTDNDAFQNFLTDTTYDTIIASYLSVIPGNGIGNTKNTGLSNLSLYQLNGSTKTVCPITGKNLSLFASASYMNLNEDDSNDNDNVGTELDLIATWALTAGLNYKVEAAYLFTDDVYGTDPDDLMFVRHSLDLKF